MARGNRRERIFRDEAYRVLFYQTLGEACEPHRLESVRMGADEQSLSSDGGNARR